MKRLINFKNLPFKLGTNRLVILLKQYVIKIPLGFQGIKANKLEYYNYINAQPGKVAKTTKIWFLLYQERLTNIAIYPRYINKENLPKYAQPLFDIKVNNRLQIGQDAWGNWKIFDYEDVKFMEDKK